MERNNDEKSDSRRWVWVLLGRGLWFVIQGTLLTALQVTLVFVFLVWLFLDSNSMVGAIWGGLTLGAAMGLVLYGGLYANVAFSSPSACRELVSRQFFGAVSCGMVLGATAASVCIFGYDWLLTRGYLIDRDFITVTYMSASIPLAMLCGSVGGVMWKWGRLKAAWKGRETHE